MGDNVSIPRDEARKIAHALRGTYFIDRDALAKWADLLDPRPSTLRDRVAQVVYNSSIPTVDHPEAFLVADDVLAYLAELFTTELDDEVMPNLDGMSPQGIYVRAYGESRAAVVRRLRGES